jgi:hypothetical protein
MEMKITSSYFGNRILSHVEEDMEYLSEEGFTGVIHTFSEEDLKFYSKAFKDIVKVSHDADLDVDLDPWGVGGVFGGEAFSAWIAENPDYMQVSRDGKPRPLACLNSPDFRKFMAGWIEKAVETGADGLFWDEPHLYIPRRSDSQQSWTCTCKLCSMLFREKYGHDFPNEKTPEVIEFRNWSMTSFLSEMVRIADGTGIRNTVCILPDELGGAETANWEDVASIRGIDIISTDPYWTFTNENVGDFVKKYCVKIIELASRYNLESQIWIQGFRIPSGREDEIRIAIETVAGEGIRNLAIWGFEACAQISSIACENPELAWETALKAFQKVSRIK